MWSLDAEKNSSSSSSEDEADKEDESEGVSHSPAVLKGKESQLPHFSSLDKLERPKYLKQSIPQPLREFSLQTSAPYALYNRPYRALLIYLFILTRHEKKEGMKNDKEEVSLLEKKVFLQEIELQTKVCTTKHCIFKLLLNGHFLY